MASFPKNIPVKLDFGTLNNSISDLNDQLYKFPNTTELISEDILKMFTFYPWHSFTLFEHKVDYQPVLRHKYLMCVPTGNLRYDSYYFNVEQKNVDINLIYADSKISEKIYWQIKQSILDELKLWSNQVESKLKQDNIVNPDYNIIIKYCQLYGHPCFTYKVKPSVKYGSISVRVGRYEIGYQNIKSKLVPDHYIDDVIYDNTYTYYNLKDVILNLILHLEYKVSCQAAKEFILKNNHSISKESLEKIIGV